MFLSLTNIKKSFGQGDSRVEVLKGIDLSIEKGEFCVLLGPSGSGKSTLMNILGCLDRPSGGSYQLDGKEVAQLSDDELAQRLAVVDAMDPARGVPGPEPGARLN